MTSFLIIGQSMSLIFMPRRGNLKSKKIQIMDILYIKLDKISADKNAENLACCLKFCPPKYFPIKEVPTDWKFNVDEKVPLRHNVLKMNFRILFVKFPKIWRFFEGIKKWVFIKYNVLGYAAIEYIGYPKKRQCFPWIFPFDLL